MLESSLVLYLPIWVRRLFLLGRVRSLVLHDSRCDSKRLLYRVHHLVAFWNRPNRTPLPLVYLSHTVLIS